MNKIFIGLALFYSVAATASDFKCPDGKTYPVSLTFDDGPAGAKTKKVLDILKEKEVKGTFFVLGENFETKEQKDYNYPILDRMKAEGHYIGSHTFHHSAHSKLPDDKAYENIDKATEVLKGYMSPIVRLPYGDGSFPTKDPERKIKNDKIMNHIKEKGLTHVGWDVDTNDWDVKKRPYVLESMMKQICQEHGGVILFHDIHQNTVDHLAGWIDEIKAAGHTIVPLNHFYKNLNPAGKTTTPPKKEEVKVDCPRKEVKPEETIDSLDKKIKEILGKLKL